MSDVSRSKTYLLCCAALIVVGYTESKLLASQKSYNLYILRNIYLLDPNLGRDAEYVTCGTVAKLYNMDLKVRLHSHDVKYGAGSGQQSVTGTELSEDINSHWEIKSATGKYCKRGYISQFFISKI